MAEWEVREGGLDDPRVIALIDHHATSARAATIGGCGHSFAVERLRADDVRFFAAWRGDEVVGIGALKRLSGEHGEIKSMHTSAGARGVGIGSGLLTYIMAEARATGMRRLSLETHPGAHFAAAIALYRRHGFADCPPFGDYREDPSSLFMSKEIS